MSLAPRRLAAITVAGLVWLAISGCGSTPEREHAGTQVPVKLRDFHIKAPKHVPAGEVTFAIDNKGPVHHELIVIRDDGEASHGLPMRGDNVTVDEDGLGDAVAGALEPEPAGHHTLKVDLKPGEYYLICNMAGHYLSGMNAEVEVQ
jgi:uncharacterized cupredoxin-like copper-binding protein